MPCAFDTNIFAYAAGIGQSESDRRKVALAEDLLAEVLKSDSLVMPIQVAAELHNLLVRKGGLSRQAAALLVQDYMIGATIIPSDLDVLEAAFDAANRHQLQTYDAIILAAAAEAGCSVLYSEDMQHGFIWNGVMVVNPFS